jgi:hypothetical protein
MYHLGVRGFAVARTDRNEPAFDILARRNGHCASIRVKTSGSRTAQWNVQADGSFIDYIEGDASDFVVIVLQVADDPEIYVVPTDVVVKVLRDGQEVWLKTPARNGERHKVTNHRAIVFGRDGKLTNLAMRGIDWPQYRDARHLLVGMSEGGHARRRRG